MTAAYASRSSTLIRAGIVFFVVQLPSHVFWILGRRDREDWWAVAALDVFALLYFYRQWSRPNAEHRTLHFLFMCQFLVSSSYFAFQQSVRMFFADPLAMSPWWYQLLANIMWTVNQFLLIGYSVLKIRSRKNPKGVRRDVSAFIDKIGPPGPEKP